MLKKEFTYKDPETGEEMKETVYFHLYESDLVKNEMSVKGGMGALLQRIIDTENMTALVGIFDDLIARSVGYRNERGKFVRTKQFAEEFMSSESYSELFLELVGTESKAVEFLKAILPANLSEELTQKLSGQLELPKTDGALKVDKKLEDYTQAELLTMDQALFDALVGRDPNKMSHEHLQLAFQRKTAAQAVENAAKK